MAAECGSWALRAHPTWLVLFGTPEALEHAEKVLLEGLGCVARTNLTFVIPAKAGIQVLNGPFALSLSKGG